MVLVSAEKEEQLAQLCEKHGVEALYLFGSITHDDSRAANDLDFLVRFKDEVACSPFDRYFGLREGLEELYSMPIDLVDETAMTNPYFIGEVMATRVPVYGQIR